MNLNTQNIFEVAFGTGMMSVLVHLAGTDMKEIKARYSTKDGHFLWSLFLSVLAIRFILACFTVWFVFYFFEVKTVQDFKDFRVVGGIVLGILSYELFPFMAFQAIDTIQQLTKRTKDNMLKDEKKEDK